MHQTNAIILSIESGSAQRFESLFEKEVMPLWRRFKDQGKFISASLTPVQAGSEEKPGVKHYILHVELPSMAEHSEFDSDEDFNRFLGKARTMQPEEPLVWLGETLYQV